MNIKALRCESIDLVTFVEDKAQWLALVNTNKNSGSIQMVRMGFLDLLSNCQVRIDPAP